MATPAQPPPANAMLAEVLAGIGRQLADHEGRLRKLDRLRYTIEGAIVSGAGTWLGMYAARGR